MTTWAKYSETLRPFEINCTFSGLAGMSSRRMGSTHRDEPLHCIEFLPVASGIELFANILDLVIWGIEI